MASSTADVTVVIPHFQSPGLLRRALASVDAQVVRPTEILVVDDASEPEAARAAAAEVSKYSSARMLRLRTNSGPGVARNAGWSEATGTWLAFLDADDEWHPHKLEQQTAILEQHPEAVLSSHEMALSEDPPQTPLLTGAARVVAEMISYRSLLLRNRVATSSAMVRRQTSARFPVHHRHCEDYALWLALAHDAPVVHLPVALGTRHPSPTGLSAQGRRMEAGELAALRSQVEAGRVPRVALPALLSWSVAKYAVRRAGRSR